MKMAKRLHVVKKDMYFSKKEFHFVRVYHVLDWELL